MNATLVPRPGSLRRILFIIGLLGVLAMLGIGPGVRTAAAATFTVTSTSDGPGMCPAIVFLPWFNYPCTLRAAIQAVNQQPAGTGPHTINFNIGYGVQTISPASPLPPITQPVVIDGGTQLSAGWTLRSTLGGGGTFVTGPCSSYKFPGLGHPCIELNGAGLSANGLTLAAGNSTVRKLVINRFNGSGIRVTSNTNVIATNSIGTDVTGAYPRPNTQHGIIVDGSSGSAANNLIYSNLISGNSRNGVLLTGSGASNNRVTAGNYIGTTGDGGAAIPNATATADPSAPDCLVGQGGVVINGGASSNIIGGTMGAGNVISGNGTNDPVCQHAMGSGVVIDATGLTDDVNPNIWKRTYNQVLGNYIGTNATGTGVVGNAWYGVLINNASNNQVGVGSDQLSCTPGVSGASACSTASGGGNVIGGNTYGVGISSPGGLPSVSNTVQGNFIGTNASNAVSSTLSRTLSNLQDGVDLGGRVVGDHNVNGTTVRANFVENNGVRGIYIASSNVSNTVQNNTALYNLRDLEDDNPVVNGACANTWSNNTFMTEVDNAGTGVCIN